MKGRIIICLFFLLPGVNIYGQGESSDNKPLFPAISQWYDITVDQSQLELMGSLDQPKDQPLRFALPVIVSLDPSNAGTVRTTSEETIWVMPITSKGALSLNVIFMPYHLPDGAHLFIYDENHEIVRGPYTNRDATGGSMPVLPVPGDRMIIECHFPGKTIPAGSIGISRVNHDFAGFFSYMDEKDEYFGASGSCEADINCTTDPNYLRSSRSVCRLIITGTDLCTGVLVDNTGLEYKAYVLTAQHCIQSAADAANTIFVFNYASPWCEGPDKSNMHSITGSVLKATNLSVDFSLVELSSFPSLVTRPYLSGWDISLSAPTSTYTIHHPEGDVMKLSRDLDPPSVASYPAGDYVAGGFWKISDWEMGTTESGSSGAPLFDQYYRVRGTLTGGSADCAIPENDYFARIGRMFNISDVPAANLKSWLDPIGSDAVLTSGRDPYAYNLSLSDTLANMPAGDNGQFSVYPLPDFGYSTGTNSDSIFMYAEAISFSGTGEIAWVSFHIAHSAFISPVDSVRIFIWSGGAEPGSVIASKQYKIRESKNDTWFEADFGRTIQVTGPYYLGYKLFYRTPLGTSQPQFAVKHSAPHAADNMNTAWFNDGNGWKPFTQHPSFPMPVSLDVSIIMVENSVLNPVDEDTVDNEIIKVYPNPFSGEISFEMVDISENTSLTICDNAGQIVFTRQYRYVFPGKVTVSLPLVKSGIYHYHIENDYSIFSGTIIKVTR